MVPPSRYYVDVAITIIPEGRAAGSFQFLNLHHYKGTTVQALEKHGMKDKGGTIDHQFLFLQKK